MVEFQPIDQSSKFNKQIKNDKTNQTAGTSFEALLGEKVSKGQIYVPPAEKIKKTKFRSKKDKIEKGEGIEEVEEDESIYKTVKDLKKKLKALEELERKNLGI
ncbi:hypothetical protein DID75_04035 [Candidatus Marinamargulisbacteria bacterium SCGC AG-410-N11]|nr:hypothetical protein DID75_04035 [Candidatus Marinamargulisbacteria bacterium SCGC AG-410-N11]